MTRHTLVLSVLACVPAAAYSPAQSARTAADKEEFLRTAAVIKKHEIGEGVTNTERLTLEKDGVTHDAHLQTVDISKLSFQTVRGVEMNFRDSFKFNIAAYELGKLLGIADMIPPSVERKYSGVTGAFTWWVDDVMMSENKRKQEQIDPPDTRVWNMQMHVVHVFDQLIFNTDRNLGNLLIDKSWNIWMIDHSRAFRIRRDLPAPRNLVQCDRSLLERMRKLDKTALKEKLGEPGLLTNMEIDGLLARRDKVVKVFDDLIKQKGAAAVLYDRPGRN